MIKRYDDQLNITISNNYNNQNNKKNNHSIINSESEKSAIMKMYSEVISSIFTQHLNN